MGSDGHKPNSLRSSGQETESELVTANGNGALANYNANNNNTKTNGAQLNSNGSILYPDSAYPVSIDLTGPLPVISVMRSDQYLINPNYKNGQLLDNTKFNQSQSYSSEKLYNKLIQEAPNIPARSQSKYECSEENEKYESDTSDINQELLSEGKKFIRRNFFALTFAHLVSIAFLLGIKPIQALLLRTGSIHNKNNTLKRYLSCVITLKNIYECDFSDKSSQTNVELASLQKVEDKVAKNFRVYAPPPVHCMKLDPDEQQLLDSFKKDLVLLTQVDTSVSNIKNLNKIYTTVNPDIPMSQYDLAIIQFTFFGLISLFPKIFGIHETGKSHPDGLNGFIHLWAVIGKRLGLEDRFNLCLEKNFDHGTNLRIFNDIFLFSFKLTDEPLVKLWKSMTSGSSRYFFFFRTKAMLHFMLRKVANIDSPNCKNVFSLMNFFERMSYYSYLFLLNWVLRLWLTRTLMNLICKAVLFLGHKLYLRRIKKESYGLDASLISIYTTDETVKTIS